MAPVQKRLTRILLALAIAGSLLIAGLWWDSTRYSNLWISGRMSVGSEQSCFEVLEFETHLKTLLPDAFLRVSTESFSSGTGKLFPKPEWDSRGVGIPYYLILIGYLVTLTLAWLLLMNRLARREKLKESRASSRQQ